MDPTEFVLHLIGCFEDLSAALKLKLKELLGVGIMTKQKSVNKLFPTFAKRVDALTNLGGTTLVEKLPDRWHFTVPSSKGDGVKYDVYVKFVSGAAVPGPTVICVS